MNLERIINLAENRGASLSELFIYSDREVSASISRGGKISLSSSKSEGIGIRVIVNGREGFSYTSKLDLNEIEKTISRAIKIAKKSGRKLETLPKSKDKIPSVNGFYYEEIKNITEDQVFKFIKEIFDKTLKYNGYGKLISCRSDFKYIEWKIINSYGLEYEFHETHNIVSYSALAIKNGASALNYDYIYDRKIIDLDEAKEYAIKVIKLAENGVPETSIKSGIYPVILSPRAFITILNYTLYPILKANFYPRRLERGSIIGSEKLNLIEDPLNPLIPRSSPIDHEGTIRRRKIIIEKGELKTLLYDHYYAERENVESTGNGFRTPILTWPRMTKPYQGLPSPEIGSLKIINSNKSIHDLANQVNNGLYVIYVIGAHGADPASGRFSATAPIAFKIENGGIGKPVKHATISGDLSQLLNIIDVGNEEKLVFNTLSPSVLVSELKIAGD